MQLPDANEFAREMAPVVDSPVGGRVKAVVISGSEIDDTLVQRGLVILDLLKILCIIDAVVIFVPVLRPQEGFK